MGRLPHTTVGIIGGGQLGLMLCEAARRIGVATVVLDPDSDAPAARRSDATIVGDRFDSKALDKLCSASDIVTFEIEHADTASLIRTARRTGVRILPAPETLDLIRDKGTQRAALAARGIPQPEYALWDNPDEAPPQRFTPPYVQKVRRGGYDGRGVAIIESDVSPRLSGPSLVERLVDIECELAVIVAAGAVDSPRESRPCVSYPPVRMDFDPLANICTRVVAPAGVSTGVERRAREIAEEAVVALEIVGVCAVELFVTRTGEILVNELAPRPHNSGHLTIEAHITNQFEQHLRAICGLPLGRTDLLRPAVMINLLGGPNTGDPVINGLEQLLEIPETHLHLYDKYPCSPGRKMGHVTCLGASVEEATARARRAELAVSIDGGLP